jgi:hypothetical protein
MRMVRFPSGKEHGQARHKRREGARLGGAQAHCRRLAETRQRAIQRIDAVAIPKG